MKKRNVTVPPFALCRHCQKNNRRGHTPEGKCSYAPTTFESVNCVKCGIVVAGPAHSWRRLSDGGREFRCYACSSHPMIGRT